MLKWTFVSCLNNNNNTSLQIQYQLRLWNLTLSNFVNIFKIESGFELPYESNREKKLHKSCFGNI